MKPSVAQTLTALAVLVLACLGLAFDTGTGTYSAFGFGEFNLLCPLGGLEALLASKAFIPQAIVSLIVVAILALVFGRAWCAWVCPTRIVRRVLGKAATEEKLPANPCAGTFVQAMRSDTRVWVLAIVLVSALIVGFPVFCLVCPIGLTFGTVASIWRAVQFNDLTLAVLLFPAALVIELVAVKRWCVQVCPIAGLLALAGRVAPAFRPRVDTSSCLRARGGDCHACKVACPENIDLHVDTAHQQLADCTRCAECLHVCPTASISMPVLPGKSDGEKGQVASSSQTSHLESRQRSDSE